MLMPRFIASVMVLTVFSLASSNCYIIAVGQETPGGSPLQTLIGESDHVILRGSKILFASSGER
jgi:hypothetical protein